MEPFPDLVVLIQILLRPKHVSLQHEALLTDGIGHQFLLIPLARADALFVS